MADMIARGMNKKAIEKSNKIESDINEIKSKMNEILILLGQDPINTSELVFNYTSNKVGYAYGSLILTTSDTDMYDLYWGNNLGVVSDYDKISTVTSGQIYNFISKNFIPVGATKVLAINNTNTIAFNIPVEKQFSSAKLYSFGALSDVHIDGDGNDYALSITDFEKALNFFNNQGATFSCVSGDLTLDGRDVDYVELINCINRITPTPTIYMASGNHDVVVSPSYFKNYLGKDFYYSFTHGNDTFVFLGMHTTSATTAFTTEQMDWLEALLELKRNERVFLFYHVYLDNTCGNVNNLALYTGINTNTPLNLRFTNMMTRYKNVIYFSGHSHLEFALQKFGEYANIFDNGTMCHRVHIPSCAKPRKNELGITNTETVEYSIGSQGYIVDVYENCIVLRGRDFVEDKFLPLAQYIIDTTIIPIEALPTVEPPSNDFVVLNVANPTLLTNATVSGNTVTFLSAGGSAEYNTFIDIPQGTILYCKADSIVFDSGLTFSNVSFPISAYSGNHSYIGDTTAYIDYTTEKQLYYAGGTVDLANNTALTELRVKVRLSTGYSTGLPKSVTIIGLKIYKK